jgi:uncharacterized protein (TIGR00251 family)
MFIKIKVFADCKNDEIVEKKDDGFGVRVKEKAEEGRANRAVIKVIANYFKIDESRIKLTKGFKERNKIFEIKNKNQLNQTHFYTKYSNILQNMRISFKFTKPEKRQKNF